MQTLYIVLSRDKSDFIYATYDIDKAETAKNIQNTNEEMAGGHPSVYIISTVIK